MLGTIIYIVGLVLAIMAVLDIFKKNISLLWKIIFSVIVLATSWLGIILYYLIGKDNIESWVK